MLELLAPIRCLSSLEEVGRRLTQHYQGWGDRECGLLVQKVLFVLQRLVKEGE